MIIPVKSQRCDYNIVLKRGSLYDLKQYLNLDRKVLIVTDCNVPKIYSEIAAKQCKEPYIVTINDGENSKSFENFNHILSKMVDLKFTRTDCVIAVGGGVVGDLAGFVAASFMRGVDFYNVPTTLLSQVDSSIGGKVAINFKGYKNIIGAFYAPNAVIIDPDTLKTLPERQISNGLAESLKMSLTSDIELFKILENDNIDENIEKIIELSLKIKKNVVESDEKEAGLRKILNFGHTIGHAIESMSFDELYHGECVALGMIPMCSKSVKLKLLPVLRKLNLPTNIKVDKQKIYDAIALDKKKNGDNITVIFVNEIGQFEMKNISYIEISKILEQEECI